MSVIIDFLVRATESPRESQFSPNQIHYETRKILRYEMNRVKWNLGLLVLVIMDLTFVILQLTISANGLQQALFIVTVYFGIIFIFELMLRFYAFGMTFWRDWLNWFDSIIVVGSFVVLVSVSVGGRIASVARILRVVLRLFRLGVLAYRNKRAIPNAVREIVTSNKQRYVDDEFNLDLAYVTSRVIVMSKPAISLETLFRNNLEEVARFFNTKHPNHYKIVNCCAEYEYPSDKFHGNVWRFPVEDHNCPTLKTILDFCEQAKPFMEESTENVLGIHCKGGKGRSGTMVCCWLLYNGDFITAEQVMTHFGKKRTDAFKKGKIQGVETASQVRYVRYWDKLCKNGKTIPEHSGIALTSIKVTMTPKMSSMSNYSNWRVRVLNTYDGDPIEKLVEYKQQSSEDHTTTFAGDPFTLKGDSKIAILANDEEGAECIFYYFWFHTYFVESGYVAYEKNEVDGNRKYKKNPWKKWSSVKTELFFDASLRSLEIL
eukprot:TRINITY_DN12360_c0_g1_i1.p1 TRINITY_DN12360_c0_g1~~TRINITY_DN12360_c0_g1_i1.p1  ORF type:complete len:498 (+),score=102.62 TRINITY_DN12360_c0_g1_i1:32-1495(+)